MVGPTTGPNSQSDPRTAAAERAILSVERPASQQIAQPRAASRRPFAPMLRHAPRSPQNPTGRKEPAPDRDMPASLEATRSISHGSAAQSLFRMSLQALNRAGRITFDALLLIVFAPVIAIWWLNEKRRKR